MIAMNAPTLLAVLGFVTATPAAKEGFDGSKEMDVYKRALDELTVPSAIISKGRCYVEYRGKVCLDGPCTIATGNAGVISVGSPIFDSVDNLTAFVVERVEGGARNALLNPIIFKKPEGYLVRGCQQ
jgi:hypothetical protein